MATMRSRPQTGAKQRTISQNPVRSCSELARMAAHWRQADPLPAVQHRRPRTPRRWPHSTRSCPSQRRWCRYVLANRRPRLVGRVGLPVTM